MKRQDTSKLDRIEFKKPQVSCGSYESFKFCCTPVRLKFVSLSRIPFSIAPKSARDPLVPLIIYYTLEPGFRCTPITNIKYLLLHAMSTVLHKYTIPSSSTFPQIHFFVFYRMVKLQHPAQIRRYEFAPPLSPSRYPTTFFAFVRS